MAKPIPQWHPPGGFHYYEGDVKIEARTLEKLYETVESYRAENYLPSGDVRVTLICTYAAIGRHTATAWTWLW